MKPAADMVKEDATMHWDWQHAEYRTHDGWVPQATVRWGEADAEQTTTLTAGPTVALDTRTAARDHNRRLVLAYAEGQGWTEQPAANEEDW